MTQKKAETWFNDHGFESAKYCQESFPCIIDTVLKGVPVHHYDTTYLQMDSIQCPPGNDNQNKIPVYVKCPPTKIIYDSIIMVDTLKIRDSSDMAVLYGRADSANKAAIIIGKDRDRLKTGRNTWREIAIISIIIFIGGGYLAVKLKLL